ncbi:MAG TPA: R3H domain-containing nucleic acid-binding protein [Ornithinibacter sp.]|jgi:spoIIIJ-associated protein|nr:R3H domain-containing nucleic acid-binding protein [Ornithinibacter sp.]
MSENLTQDPARNDAEPEQPTDVESINEHDESVLDVVEADVQAITDGDVDADTLDTASDDDGDVAPAASTSRQGQLEREGEVAADFLETLLDICDLDGDLEVDIDGDRAAVSIVDSEDGRVPRRLVGQNGQVLDALQELTRLAVQSATGERSRLMLDVGGHRAERRASLVTLAAEAIEEVRTSGERKPLTPMTAFERKVVHDEVLAAGLVSESEGAEPRRYVVILPA